MWCETRRREVTVCGVNITAAGERLTGMSVSSHQEVRGEVLPAVEALGGHFYTALGVLGGAGRGGGGCSDTWREE